MQPKAGRTDEDRETDFLRRLGATLDTDLEAGAKDGGEADATGADNRAADMAGFSKFSIGRAPCDRAVEKQKLEIGRVVLSIRLTGFAFDYVASLSSSSSSFRFLLTDRPVFLASIH